MAQREYYEQALPVIERRLKILYEMEACYKANEIENCIRVYAMQERNL